MLDSDSVEPLFTFVNMEKALKETNRSYFFYPGRIPPDAVRGPPGSPTRCGSRRRLSRQRGAPSARPPLAGSGPQGAR